MAVSKPEITFYSPSESAEWLQNRLSHLNIDTLQNLSEKTGIDKGTLSRYFRHERRPSIDCIKPLCTALQISPELLLKVLGAIAR
jgi:transcriptional regulator with XRE-family HTH domain